MAKKSNYPIPKGFKDEKGWRRLMARTSKVKINGQEFALQSVSPSWYFGLSDECKMGSDKRDTTKYMDLLFKNVVTAPIELSKGGMEYFDDREDIETAEKLVTEIESFLRPGKGYGHSVQASAKE